MMNSLKIASWNVNSLRVRLPHVLAWLNEHQPDIVALQELKIPDADFPFEVIQDAGYSVIASGQRTYNGVAVLSRNSATDIVTDLPGLEDPQRRVLAVTVDDIRVINVYIPNGESITSEKYQYKLNWLDKFELYLRAESKKHSKIVILGDFNIAPANIDVHDPAEWEGQVLFSEPERQAFYRMLQLGFQDCFRQLNPDDKSYSWWDYRMNAFKRDRGLRIDHILANHRLAMTCKRAYIDKTPREWERPSDHAPVVAEFELPETA